MKYTLFLFLSVVSLLTSCNEKENDRKLAEQLNNEGIIQMQSEQFDKAEKLLKAAIEADDTYAEPHAYLIQMYLNENNFDAALKESEVVIKKAPEEAENWVLAGILNEKKGNRDRAFEYYEESLTLFKKRLKERNETDSISSGLPKQDEVNIIFSYLLLEEEEKSNASIEDLQKRFPNNTMIQKLYDFDKEMYLESLFPEME